jgi:F-type H+-transporting ATPase subunit gamma
MAGSKEIRTKIKSVENTRKITRAMEMVAAAKMRRAQERMRAARPYAEKIRNVAAHLSHANPEYRHAFLVKRESVKNVGLIIVTSDKGLCGGLNTNLLRLAVHEMKAWEADGKGLTVCPIGNKGYGFMNRIGAKVKSHLTGFVNTMRQEPCIEQLLPLSGEKLGAAEGSSWDYIYEPDAKKVIDELLLRYIETLVYQAVVENIASEQSSRMVAMKAASDNAKSVINELKLVYNKARQAAITKEISEIVGGAAAIG